jgi:hypothetical protein
MQNNASAELTLPGVRTRVEVLRPPAARFELLVDVADEYRAGGGPAGITVTVEYRAEAFAAEVIRWLADDLLRVLDALATAPATRIGALGAVPQLPATVAAPVEAAPVGYLAPRTDLERRLAAIWAGALGVDRVGVHDNFFALGGTSLGAVRVAARISTAERLPVTAAQIFAAPTVAALAGSVAATPAGPPPPIPRLPRVARPRPAPGEG